MPSIWTLNDLSDEIILKISTYLSMKDLICFSQVSQRIRIICQDMTIWKQVNMCGKKVPTIFIEKAIENGCQYISLANSRINGRFCYLTKRSSLLKYLDLSNCDAAHDDVLEELIGSCHSLEKLSLGKLTLGLGLDMIQTIIENGQTLKVSIEND